MVKLETLEAIIADRSAIVQNVINHECGAGRMSPQLAEEINGFANLVFYEAGWDLRIAEKVNGKPEFFVQSFDPSARD